MLVILCNVKLINKFKLQKQSIIFKIILLFIFITTINSKKYHYQKYSRSNSNNLHTNKRHTNGLSQDYCRSNTINNNNNPLIKYNKKLQSWKINYLTNLEKLLTLQNESFVYRNFFWRPNFDNDNSTLYFHNAYNRGDSILYVSPSDVCEIYDIINSNHSRYNLTLVTLGHDTVASPMNYNAEKVSIINNKEIITYPNYQLCFISLLNHKTIKYYFVNQHMSTFTHPKLKFVPIGLGRMNLKSRLHWSHMKRLIKTLKEEHLNDEVKYDIIANNMKTNHSNYTTLSRMKSDHVLNDLFGQYVHITNCYKDSFSMYDSVNMFHQYSKSIFVWSPKGTHFDCWRHWESLYVGTIPIVPDDHTLRDIFGKLPVIFTNFTDLTISKLENELDRILSLQCGDMDMERLTTTYWQNYIKNIN
jgi:hypothetical protein